MDFYSSYTHKHKERPHVNRRCPDKKRPTPKTKDAKRTDTKLAAPRPRTAPQLCETPEDWTLMSDAFRRRICEDARQGLPRGPAGHELGGPFWVTACP